MSVDLKIAAMGMACPIGLHAPAACAAMRCRINRKEELEYLGVDGEPIVGSALHEWFEHGTPRLTRIARLAAGALIDACADRGLGMLERVPLIFALSSTLSEAERARAPALVAGELELRLAPERVGVVAEDAAGGYRALVWARDLLARGEADACMVCAVDSLIAARELMRLEGGDRLLNARNSDGMIPGEAAACLLVERAPSDPLARVRGIGLGREPASLTNAVPLRADGLVQAAGAALDEAGVTLADVDLRLSDASGEGFFFKEQALMVTRLLAEPKPELPLWTCTTTLGFIGAAAGVCNLITTIAAREQGFSPGPLALACAGSEAELRAAVVIEQP